MTESQILENQFKSGKRVSCLKEEIFSVIFLDFHFISFSFRNCISLFLSLSLPVSVPKAGRRERGDREKERVRKDIIITSFVIFPFPVPLLDEGVISGPSLFGFKSEERERKGKGKYFFSFSHIR